MRMIMKKLFVAHCRALLWCSAMAILLSVCSGVSAQTVSISPQTGNVISAASYSEEKHIVGYGGTWMHNQMPMTLMSSDESTLTENGLMSVHANNIGTAGNLLAFAAGENISNYMSLSLPKGYRFTGYKLVLAYQKGQGSTFEEKDAAFSATKRRVSIASESTTQEYTLARTSMTADDMDNVLYFKMKPNGGMAYVTVKSFVITFECTDPFTEALAPGASAIYGSDCVALPFATQRVDLGPITRQTKKYYTSYKYTYTNVRDLHANFLLYDKGGITSGTAIEGQKADGHITSANTDGGHAYMGLANDTYWLEVPADALSQDGTTRIPLGYRIVGATLRCAAAVKSAPVLGQDIYITDNLGRYLNASLEYTTTPVVWHTDTDGHVWTGSNTYLTHDKTWGGSRTSDLKTTSRKRDAREYQIDANGLHWNGDYVGYSDGKATYEGAAAIISDTTGSDGSSYTVKLYDKTGNTVAATAAISGENPMQEISIDHLNNDAIKFQVEGLAEGQSAHVSLEVQLEALNPYIDKMDISCTQPSGEKKLKNQYLADDFTIGTNGKVDFSVPTNFGTTGLRFAFEGLHSKRADETYPDGSSDEFSRYHFVRSAYYDLIGENLQGHRADAADHVYTDKVVVTVAGDKAFRSNNSDEFKAGTSGNSTFYYEETRYTNDAYASQGGSWQDMTVNASDGYVKRYLVVCDETRYNIAPTTTPRHAFYAYYSTDLRLSTVDYKPVLTYKKVYNDAVIPSGHDDNYYVGVSVSLTDADDQPMDEGVGYVYAKQVVEQIQSDIEAKKDNAPVDAKHILYFDASKINSMLFSDTDASWGNLTDLQKVLGQNALIFLPEGVTDSHDNVTSKSASGDDFVAENNIVLTDQWPFFSPYDIRVNAANEVSYARKVTNTNNTKKWVSLVLPFTIAVDPETGTYANDDDQTEFTFYQMNVDNAFSRPQGGDLTFADIDGHFSPYTGQTVTQPNEAYVVRIDKTMASDDDPTLMFVVRQSGATIISTPATADQPLIESGTSTGTVDGSRMTLVNEATYAGAYVPSEQGVFYFNKDKFVSSLNVKDIYPAIFVLPFRSYYACANANLNSIRYIHISTEPNTDITGISGATAETADDGLVFSAQEGRLSVKANKDLRVSIRNISGQTVNIASLRAGETRTVALPSGIYVVNGVKVVVK